MTKLQRRCLARLRAGEHIIARPGYYPVYSTWGRVSELTLRSLVRRGYITCRHEPRGVMIYTLRERGK